MYKSVGLTGPCPSRPIKILSPEKEYLGRKPFIPSNSLIYSAKPNASNTSILLVADLIELVRKALILAFPLVPFFVVIKTTPLAPLEPYIAVADASLRT